MLEAYADFISGALVFISIFLVIGTTGCLLGWFVSNLYLKD